MAKKKKGGSGGANWMDTYGDMVTLLLCFFVMLYSMSTVDSNKWALLVESFNPSVIEEETKLTIGQSEGTDEDMTFAEAQTTEEILAQAYMMLAQYMETSGMSDKMSVSKGSGYIFISFDDTVFFDGDQYVLRPEGKAVLDEISKPIAAAKDSINEVRVLGHTAQGNPDRPNNVNVDRFLASNRATIVTVYLQEKNIIDPARLVSVGYGQWRPVASNETSETRAENRRVEIIISGLDAEGDDDYLEQYYSMRGDSESVSDVVNSLPEIPVKEETTP